jgi:hypothetical protein
MGIYVRLPGQRSVSPGAVCGPGIGPRWLRLRLSRRGTRASIGPRLLRWHGGSGGPGVSTGAGPVTWYLPLRRRRWR